ncbi:MAG TPA: ribosome small subunit-dependent GTPase A [Bacteroidales bacterium]|nr:ribosome small subunit-dependent GTPase A [Bacteroidales bacterium]
MKGLVLKVVGNQYVVKSENGVLIDCVLKGKLRLQGVRSTNPVIVGDWIEYILMPDGTGVIEQVLQRKNYIVRKSVNLSKQKHILAANIDCAYLVVTLLFPETNFEFIDRFLVTAEAYQVPAALVLNKCDLYDELTEQVNEFISIYKKAGYPVFSVSAKTGLGLDDLKAFMVNKVNFISGNSGVGKSSLINKIEPMLNLKIQDISLAHFKGKHTTTFSQMYELSSGGYIIDSPGIKGFSFIDIKKEELFHYFPEIFKITPQCKYYNCTHTNEPNCAVKEAVVRGEIHELRYRNYLSMFFDEDEKHR